MRSTPSIKQEQQGEDADSDYHCEEVHAVTIDPRPSRSHHDPGEPALRILLRVASAQAR